MKLAKKIIIWPTGPKKSLSGRRRRKWANSSAECFMFKFFLVPNYYYYYYRCFDTRIFRRFFFIENKNGKKLMKKYLSEIFSVVIAILMMVIVVGNISVGMNFFFCFAVGSECEKIYFFEKNNNSAIGVVLRINWNWEKNEIENLNPAWCLAQ